MTVIRKVCVLCGLSGEIEDAHLDLAEAIGRALATTAEQVVVGIVPGPVLLGVDPVGSHQVVDPAGVGPVDAFLVLPGGLETVEDLVELMSSPRFGPRKRPVLLAGGVAWGAVKAQFDALYLSRSLTDREWALVDFLQDNDLPAQLARMMREIGLGDVHGRA